MPYTITTPFGHAVPPAPRHSVTVQLPGWANAESFCQDPRSVILSCYNAYPRMRPHRDIEALAKAVLGYLKIEFFTCYLFSSLSSAEECLEYSTSPDRDDGISKKPVPSRCILIRVFKAKDPFWAVIFPRQCLSVTSGFWSRPGVGVSSRFAEENLASLDKLVELSVGDSQSRLNFETDKHEELRQRLVQLLGRATLEGSGQPQPKTEDVYLFPSGMASIYKPHRYMTSWFDGTTVLFGMAFMDTVTALEEYGSGFKFFGLGTADDLEALKVFLSKEKEEGRKVQAIWAEFPANPILVTPDLVKLRALADEFNVILAIDDTIGSFANVDILHMTDIMVSSLTKSFNGYADAIAGSAILNPASRHYITLKALFRRHYISELYVAEVEVLLRNSQDYLSRSAKMNYNATTLVDYLGKCARNPSSAVQKVHYPTVNASRQNYQRFMRPATPEFEPGYGCLFNVEFEDIPTTKAFYNNLNIHHGPHLGAPFTLALAYSKCVYGKRLEWAAGNNLRPTQIRVTAGLEEIDWLLKIFQSAIEAADSIKHMHGAN